MKTNRSILAFLAGVSVAVLFFPCGGFAQTKVVIVDVGEVFRNYPGFTQHLESLKQDAESFKSESLQQQQLLIQKSEQIKQLPTASTEYRTAESQLAQESASLEVRQRDKMRTLVQREAQLHFQAYAEVNKLIASYCEPRGIQLVIRYNGQQMDPKNPNSVMQRVNGSVIYHNPKTDITQQIILLAKQQNATANAAPANQR